MKKGLEKFRDFGFIFPSSPSLSSITFSSHPPLLTPQPTSIPLGFHFYTSFLIPVVSFFPFSCFLSNAARPVYPDFGPLGRFQACPFRPLSSEPPAAAFCSQGACYNAMPIALLLESPMAIGCEFRRFRSSPCLTLADRKAGDQVRC